MSALSSGDVTAQATALMIITRAAFPEFESYAPSFRGEADEGGRGPGIHKHRPVVMGSGFAAARRPGMTRFMESAV